MEQQPSKLIRCTYGRALSNNALPCHSTQKHRTLDQPHSGARTPGSRKSTTQLGPSPLEMVIKNFVWKYVATSTPDVPVINAFCILLICKAFAREHISLLSGHVVLWRLWGHTSDTIDATTSDLAI